MKHLLLAIAICAFGTAYGQNNDHMLTKTEQSEYTSSTRTMTVYRFTSKTTIPLAKQHEITKSLELKDDVKTAKFSVNSTVLTVEVTKGITVADLNNVLIEYAVLLVNDDTPKGIVTKLNLNSSTN